MPPIELIARIKYEREKARQFLGLDLKEVELLIRKDFDILKLPYPPQNNIWRPTGSGVVVSWITSKNSMLYRHITGIIKEQDVTPDTKVAKEKCCIDFFSLEEKLTGYTTSSSSNAHNWSPHFRSPGQPLWKKVNPFMQPLQQISNSLPTEVYSTSSGSFERPLQLENQDDNTSQLRANLHDTQREILEALVRFAVLQEQLEDLKAPVSIDKDSLFSDQLTKAASALARERKKRAHAEKTLSDVMRECSRPVVVPVMLKIFEELSTNNTKSAKS